MLFPGVRADDSNLVKTEAWSTCSMGICESRLESEGSVRYTDFALLEPPNSVCKVLIRDLVTPGYIAVDNGGQTWC